MKKGVSGVIVSILLVLIVIASLFIVYNVVNSITKEKTSQIKTDALTTNLEIQKATILKTTAFGMNGSAAEVSVYRGAGQGNITGLRFIFENNAGESEVKEIRENLPQELETKTYCIPVTITNPTSVSVAGIFDDNITGGIKDSETNIPSEILSIDEFSKRTGLLNLDSTYGCGGADFTNDGKVNVDDSGILASNYDGAGRTHEQGDATGDGLVNVNDLGILASNYDRLDCFQEKCDINLTSCQTLNQAGKKYCLTRDINTTGTCFEILADNITLDCEGFEIDGRSKDYYSYGMDVEGRNRWTIKNCGIKNFFVGIYVYDGEGFSLINNRFISNYEGMIIEGYTKKIRFENNNVSHSGHMGIWFNSDINEDVILQKNYFQTDGFNFASPSNKKVVVNDNLIDSGSFTITNCSDCIISKNLLINSHFRMYIIRNTSIANNQISYKGDLISLERGDGISVRNNTLNKTNFYENDIMIASIKNILLKENRGLNNLTISLSGTVNSSIEDANISLLIIKSSSDFSIKNSVNELRLSSISNLSINLSLNYLRLWGNIFNISIKNTISSIECWGAITGDYFGDWNKTNFSYGCPEEWYSCDEDKDCSIGNICVNGKCKSSFELKCLPFLNSTWTENGGIMANGVWTRNGTANVPDGGNYLSVVPADEGYALRAPGDLGVHRYERVVIKDFEHPLQSWGGTIYINPRNLITYSYPTDNSFLGGYNDVSTTIRNFVLELVCETNCFVGSKAYHYNDYQFDAPLSGGGEIFFIKDASLGGWADRWIRVDWAISPNRNVYARVDKGTWRKLPQNYVITDFSRIDVGWISSYDGGSIDIKDVSLYNETCVPQWVADN